MIIYIVHGPCATWHMCEPNVDQWAHWGTHGCPIRDCMASQHPGGDTAAVPSDRRGTGARRRDTARRPAPRMGSPGRGTE
jgi:hypothetical protein